MPLRRLFFRGHMKALDKQKNMYYGINRIMLVASSAEIQTTHEMLSAGVRAVQQILLPSAALDLLLTVVFFLATNYILSRKLNLE